MTKSYTVWAMNPAGRWIAMYCGTDSSAKKVAEKCRTKPIFGSFYAREVRITVKGG